MYRVIVTQRCKVLATIHIKQEGLAIKSTDAMLVFNRDVSRLPDIVFRIYFCEDEHAPSSRLVKELKEVL